MKDVWSGYSDTESDREKYSRFMAFLPVIDNAAEQEWRPYKLPEQEPSEGIEVIIEIRKSEQKKENPNRE